MQADAASPNHVGAWGVSYWLSFAPCSGCSRCKLVQTVTIRGRLYGTIVGTFSEQLGTTVGTF